VEGHCVAYCWADLRLVAVDGHCTA
jgi:hypothetical protein